MSGGVDSSVAAYMLKEEGFDVVGVTLKLYPEVSRCCRLEDIDDARRVAHFLDIPHYVFDFTLDFKKEVVDYFITEYMAGRTPNPCVICNQKIKFGFLLKRVWSIGGSCLATGHYARIVEENGSCSLVAARDRGKSQEYFLSFLSEEVLKQVMFPLGDYTKAEIKQISQEVGLPLGPKKESQEVCFVAPDDNYISFIKRHLRVDTRTGTLINSKGELMGYHKGFFCYTFGQRRRIGIRASSPHYVIGIDPIKNVVIIGPKCEAYAKTIGVTLVLWRKGDGSFPLSAKIRYRHDPAPATVEVKGSEAWVIFEEPQFAPAPGQIAVFYEGDRVVGSGKIMGP
ncbi:MAG: tRNA 2-thiouridine(34) synthase MnmA [Deltaproteobacteria bacterium RBG_13_52_11]|nr:MAG: tRNA 2-thiouridine(34) synthase MnmA [Deltaproteobacteria bacterium RBG_13_52_11]